MVNRDTNLGRQSGITPGQQVTARFNEVRATIPEDVHQMLDVVKAMGSLTQSGMKLASDIRDITSEQDIKEGQRLRLEQEAQRKNNKKTMKGITSGGLDKRKHNVYTRLGYEQTDAELAYLDFSNKAKASLNNQIKSGVGPGSKVDGAMEALAQERDTFLSESGAGKSSIWMNAFNKKFQSGLPGLTSGHAEKVTYQLEKNWKTNLESFSGSIITDTQSAWDEANAKDNQLIEMDLQLSPEGVDLAFLYNTDGSKKPLDEVREEMSLRLREQALDKAAKGVQDKLDEAYLDAPGVNGNRVVATKLIELASTDGVDPVIALGILDRLQSNGAPLTETQFVKNLLVMNASELETAIVMADDRERSKRADFEARISIDPFSVSLKDIRQMPGYTNAQKATLEETWIKSRAAYAESNKENQLREFRLDGVLEAALDPKKISMSREEYNQTHGDNISANDWNAGITARVNNAALERATAASGGNDPDTATLFAHQAQISSRIQGYIHPQHQSLMKQAYNDAITSETKGEVTTSQKLADIIYSQYKSQNNGKAPLSSFLGITEEELQYLNGLSVASQDFPAVNKEDAISTVNRNYAGGTKKVTAPLSLGNTNDANNVALALGEVTEGWIFSGPVGEGTTTVGDMEVREAQLNEVLGKIINKANDLLSTDPNLDQPRAIVDAVESFTKNNVEFNGAYVPVDLKSFPQGGQKEALQSLLDEMWDYKTESEESYEERLTDKAYKELQRIRRNKKVQIRNSTEVFQHLIDQGDMGLLETWSTGVQWMTDAAGLKLKEMFTLGSAFGKYGDPDWEPDNLAGRLLKSWDQWWMNTLSGSEIEEQYGGTTLASGIATSDGSRIEDKDSIFFRFDPAAGTYLPFTKEDNGGMPIVFVNDELKNRFVTTPSQLAEKQLTKYMKERHPNIEKNTPLWKHYEFLQNLKRTHKISREAWESDDVLGVDAGIPESLLIPDNQDATGSGVSSIIPGVIDRDN